MNASVRIMTALLAAPKEELDYVLHLINGILSVSRLSTGPVTRQESLTVLFGWQQFAGLPQLWLSHFKGQILLISSVAYFW